MKICWKSALFAEEVSLAHDLLKYFLFAENTVLFRLHLRNSLSDLAVQSLVELFFDVQWPFSCVFPLSQWFLPWLLPLPSRYRQFLRYFCHYLRYRWLFIVVLLVVLPSQFGISDERWRSSFPSCFPEWLKPFGVLIGLVRMVVMLSHVGLVVWTQSLDVKLDLSEAVSDSLQFFVLFVLIHNQLHQFFRSLLLQIRPECFRWIIFRINCCMDWCQQFIRQILRFWILVIVIRIVTLCQIFLFFVIFSSSLTWRRNF